MIVVASFLNGNDILTFGGIILIPLCVFLLTGLTVVGPNKVCVMQLFGRYVGSLNQEGMHWVNPLNKPRHNVSLRVRNFETSKLKVNDHTGNPIEIAAVVVWKVVNAASARFDVDDYQNFVHVQSEAALRNLATAHPYDTTDDDTLSLRSDIVAIAAELCTELQERLDDAGVKVLEARISHLAYAPEIAATMLKRQQAAAIIDARKLLVDGAVGMVEMALDKIAKQDIVEMDEDRKAAMVSNLLVVLCGDKDTQPVVNTGSIYH